MLNNKPIETTQGGYSDIRLWPCYTIYSGLMLFLLPQVGFFSSILIVGTPAFLIAKWVAGRQAMKVFDHDSRKKDFDLAIGDGLSLPDTASYWSTEVKQPKLRVEKVVRQKRSGLKIKLANS